MSIRVDALRRALAASLFVPLVASALFAAQQSGVELPGSGWSGFALLGLSGLPTTIYLLTAATGRPWGQLEAGWTGLEGWQRAVASSVALLCGLTTGAALVILLLSVVQVDAQAEEESPARHTSAHPAR